MKIKSINITHINNNKTAGYLDVIVSKKDFSIIKKKLNYLRTTPFISCGTNGNRNYLVFIGI